MPEEGVVNNLLRSKSFFLLFPTFLYAFKIDLSLQNELLLIKHGAGGGSCKQPFAKQKFLLVVSNVSLCFQDRPQFAK